MTRSTPRRWLARSFACFALVPVFAATGALTHESAEPGFPSMHLTLTPAPSAPPEPATTAAPSTTTTTVAPPPPTTRPPAPATTRVTSAPVAPAPRVAAAAATPEERGAAALALIDYPWQKLGYAVRFAPGRAGVLGETNADLHVITIYIRDGQSALQLARTIAHEMGHALDFSFTTPAEAQQYLAIRNLPYDVADWYPTCDGCTDFASPAGDFAETFAYFLFGPGDFRSQIGAEPTADQMAQLTGIFSPS